MTMPEPSPRRRPALHLPDPERCRECGAKGYLVDTRTRIGYRYRRHECPQCRLRWSSWQMVVNPRRLTPRNSER
jgi:hypothetical protein